MRIVYRNKHYNVYSNKKGAYIIHNTNRDFDTAHTHINNFAYGKLIIYFCIKGILPKGKERLLKNKRFLESALRICNNTCKKKIENLIINIG